MSDTLPGSDATISAGDLDAVAEEIIALGDMTSAQLLLELFKISQLILIHLESITGIQIDGSDVLWGS